MLILLPLVATGETAEPPGYEHDIRSYNLARGRVVFTDNGMKCHETGKQGAPVFDAAEDWTLRIQQPLATLIQHAIDGHCSMPPQGDLELQDQDVAAAVAYVVHHSRLLAVDVNTLPATGAGSRSDMALCGPGNAGPGCEKVTVSDDALVNMLLMILGKDRWK